jgi:predicted ribosome quality control (RQC) complex YloA/Tae2 family protein
MTTVSELPPERQPYKLYRSSDGWEILVGKTARENDILSFKVAQQNDFWFHVAATSGSHVVVRNPDNLDRLPRDTLREAAELAALHSKSRTGGRVAVNYTQCKYIRKLPRSPHGQVQLIRHQTVQVYPQKCQFSPNMM